MRTTVATVVIAGVLLLPAAFSPAMADVLVQCPGDLNGDAVPDTAGERVRKNATTDPDVKCMHIAAGDGFVRMADGTPAYIFGFTDVTGMPTATREQKDMLVHEAMLGANFPAPGIVLDEGNKFYLTLTNVGMMMRPDLFDPHTVHWHGFPEASSIFDGVPEASVAINMMSSLTYFYQVNEPGTYMYHCHAEATEHMQMGMLGNLYVRPKQNQLADGTLLEGFTHHTGYKYVYNDGDGSTYYDVEFPIQLGSFDIEFHNASIDVQPLPFETMHDDYPMLNGRGYPDTMEPGPLAPPLLDEYGLTGKASQPVSSRIEAQAGQKILLRLSNLNVTRFYTLGTTGLGMKVVGHNAKHLRGPGGADLYYDTNSVTLGGGEALDVIIDTAGIAPGTYFLYTTNLNYLSNNQEDFGGMMTEIIINPAI